MGDGRAMLEGRRACLLACMRVAMNVSARSYVALRYVLGCYDRDTPGLYSCMYI